MWHAVGVNAEIFHIGARQHVGFGEDDGIADAPLQEFPGMSAAYRIAHAVC